MLKGHRNELNNVLSRAESNTRLVRCLGGKIKGALTLRVLSAPLKSVPWTPLWAHCSVHEQ